MKGKRETRKGRRSTELPTLEVTKEKKEYSFTLFEILTFVILLVVSFAVSYMATVFLIGDGAYTYDEEIYEVIETAITDCTKEGEGINILALQEVVDDYNLVYKDGGSLLVCTIKNGFFNGKVTVAVSKNFKLGTPIRNYKSISQYLQTFWLIFGGCIIAGTVILWIILCIICRIIIRHCLYTKETKRKHVKETAIADIENQEESVMIHQEEGIFLHDVT